MQIAGYILMLILTLPSSAFAAWQGQIVKVNDAKSYVILKHGHPVPVKLENITFPENTTAESYAKATLDVSSLALSKTATVFEEGTTEDGVTIANIHIDGRCLNDLLVVKKIMKVNDADTIITSNATQKQPARYVDQLPQKAPATQVETVALQNVSDVTPFPAQSNAPAEYYIEVEENDPNSALGFWNNRKKKTKRLVKLHRVDDSMPTASAHTGNQRISSHQRNRGYFSAENQAQAPTYQQQTTPHARQPETESERTRFRVELREKSRHRTKYRMDLMLGYNAGGLNFDADGVSGYAGTGSSFLTGMNFWEDGLFADWFTSGLMLRYRRQSSNVQIDGVGEGDLALNIYDFLGKLTLRKNTGDIHPYAGFGFGASYFVGSGITSESAYGPSIQGFAGVDYDLNDSLFLGLEADYTRSWFDLNGVDFSHDGVGAALKFGFKFN
ncbi:porin family protein [Desulfovibrio sp. JC010]|uniref:porin family protein n=1 Tax=Desulfovibrio sp. JC010 TaxID=2593641 RepID=UPI0013D15D45|nr:porin family protein [Desulfovibrio sp. JC010]NDV28118.1 porin family protein [Desulfovibrio sp. JC010]